MSGHGVIYLASQSPRRSQLLTQLGVRHELLLPDAGEDAEALEAEREGEAPLAYVERVTRAKLAAARARLLRSGRPEAPILCSDTTVSLGERIFGKPRDAADAMAILRALSGRIHQVSTAVAVSSGAAELFAVKVSLVRVGEVPDEAIQGYVASGDAFGKAGAYAIQSAFAAWIEHIEGSYSGIMGLPLFETAALLRRAGVSIGQTA